MNYLLKRHQKPALLQVGDQTALFAHFQAETMPRAPSAFRQADLARALKAVRAAGLDVSKILIGSDVQLEIATTPPSSDNTEPDKKPIETPEQLRKLL